ncbi:hypothetical protein J2Y67_003049 [Neobacillus niacini]|nr:hypothetical protein [Neobacillus niacini]
MVLFILPINGHTSRGCRSILYIPLRAVYFTYTFKLTKLLISNNSK